VLNFIVQVLPKTIEGDVRQINRTKKPTVTDILTFPGLRIKTSFPSLLLYFTPLVPTWEFDGAFERLSVKCVPYRFRGFQTETYAI
jgi:hypothetical protein